MKQLFTLSLLLLGKQTLYAQEYKPHRTNYDKSFFCGCEVSDSIYLRKYEAATDSTRAVYEYMRSRQINGNNTSNIQPPESKSYYHLKKGSFYLED